MSNRLVVIATYALPYEAQIAKASLESAEIPAFIQNEFTINMNWLLSDALGGYRLMVPECCAQEARLILESDFSAEAEENHD